MPSESISSNRRGDSSLTLSNLVWIMERQRLDVWKQWRGSDLRKKTNAGMPQSCFHRAVSGHCSLQNFDSLKQKASKHM